MNGVMYHVPRPLPLIGTRYLWGGVMGHVCLQPWESVKELIQAHACTQDTCWNTHHMKGSGVGIPFSVHVIRCSQ